MSRRSTITSAQQQQQQQRRQTIDRDAGARRSTVVELRDGDVVYRTVTSYPGLPDVGDQVSLLITHTNTVSQQIKPTAEGRSVMRSLRVYYAFSVHYK